MTAETAVNPLAQVQQRELTQRLAVSGTLKATRSAIIKARVAGELQDLNLREGDMVEIDLARQLIFFVRDGAVRWTLNTSTGSEIPYEYGGRWYGARTPTGTYSVYFERPNGWRISHLGALWRPKYFNGGIAIHGSGFIPGWPDSHGCARVSLPAMDFIYDANLAPVGTTVWVY